jgi:hypothetical protein
VHKALTTVSSIWCPHVILLSKVTRRSITLFTKGMRRPFSCSTSSGTLKYSGEADRLSFSFIDIYVPALTPRIHRSESALQFAENTTILFLCSVNTGIVREQRKMVSRCRRSILYMYTVPYWGEHGTLRNPCHYFSWRRKLVFYQVFKYSLSKKRSN